MLPGKGCQKQTDISRLHFPLDILRDGTETFIYGGRFSCFQRLEPMQHHQDQCGNRFEGHPKRDIHHALSRSWSLAASSPSGACILDMNWHGLSDCYARWHESMFWMAADNPFMTGLFEHVGELRERLMYLVKSADAMSKRPYLDESKALALISAIRFSAAGLISIRNSGGGWHDIHTDDRDMNRRCRKICDDLIMALARQKCCWL